MAPRTSWGFRSARAQARVAAHGEAGEHDAGGVHAAHPRECGEVGAQLRVVAGDGAGPNVAGAEVGGTLARAQDHDRALWRLVAPEE